MNEPLLIATVSLQEGGRIGICPLPGRWSRLDADMATIRAWQPNIVVSMTEQKEMEELGAAGLPKELGTAGIAWAHLPVRDYGCPEGEDWPELSTRLHQVLRDGGSVLLHCRGGIGRSGMVALRLLVERGEEPLAALTRLRAVRRGAVETEAQFAWASAAAGA